MSTVPVPSAEPPGWREIPATYVGKVEPNYFCRGWNPKRSKYCRHRAGAGTDHVGEGRCSNHGGKSPIKHGLYSVIQRERVADLVAHAVAVGPMDTMPELAAARALFIEWVERYDERTQALLAWHASYTPAMRPIPDDLVYSLETVVDELEALRGDQSQPPVHVREAQPHGGWLKRLQRDEDDGEEADEVTRAIKHARKLIGILQTPPEVKPREVPDLADGHRILDTISKILERREKTMLAKAVTAENFNRVMTEMGRVVVEANAELDPSVRLERIRNGWNAIRIA